MPRADEPSRGQKQKKCGKFACHSSSSSRFSKSIVIKWPFYKGTETSLFYFSFLYQTNRLNNWQLVCQVELCLKEKSNHGQESFIQIPQHLKWFSIVIGGAIDLFLPIIHRRINRLSLSLFPRFSLSFQVTGSSSQSANQFTSTLRAGKLAVLSWLSWGPIRCTSSISVGLTFAYSNYCFQFHSYFYCSNLGSVMEEPSKSVTRRLSTR